jgi:hypothetical protein
VWVSGLRWYLLPTACRWACTQQYQLAGSFASIAFSAPDIEPMEESFAFCGLAAQMMPTRAVPPSRDGGAVLVAAALHFAIDTSKFDELYWSSWHGSSEAVVHLNVCAADSS